MIVLLLFVIGQSLFKAYQEHRLGNQDPMFTLEQIKEKVVNSNMVIYFNEIYESVKISIEGNKLLFNIDNDYYEFELKNSILHSSSPNTPLTNQVYMTVYDAIGLLHGLESEDTFKTYNHRDVIHYELRSDGIKLIKGETLDIEIDINKKPPFIEKTSFDIFMGFTGDTIDRINRVNARRAEISINNYARALNVAILNYFMINGNYPNDYNNLEVNLAGERPINCNISFVDNKVRLTHCIIPSYSDIKTCSYINGVANCQ